MPDRLRVGSGRHGIPLDEIIEDAPAAIYIKDSDGRYLYVNHTFETISRATRDEIIGLTDFDLFPSDIAAIYRRNDVLALEESSPVRLEEPASVEDQKLIFATVKFRVATGELVGVCGISTDVTKQHDVQNNADARFGRLLDTLTPQEVRVLDLVAAGLSDKEIAEALSLSRDTVRHHVSHLLGKLRKRRAQVIIEMLKRGQR